MQMKTIIMFTLSTAAALLVATGCGSSSADGGNSDKKTTVVASFYPLAWMAEQAGGKDVEVTNLIPAGTEPHDYELTPRDVAALQSADVVLYVGGDFQPAVEAALKNSKAKKIDVLETPGLKLREATDEGHDGEDEAEHDGEGEHAGESGVDPHIWLDPAKFNTIAKDVSKELDWDSAELDADLDELNSQFENGLKTCERREVFTSHAAFGYMTDAYDLKQIAITGLSPDGEPTPRDLESVAEKANDAGATTIFFETLVSPKLAKQVAKTVGAKTAVLDPIEGIADEKIADGASYISVMGENLSALRSALDCS
jgi:zinc transport system substrate-binding protein